MKLMSKILLGDIDEPPKKRSSINTDLPGSLSNTLGTGKHAQDSVVWLTIKWSLSLGCLLSCILIFFTWPVSPEGIHPPIEPKFPIEELKTIWGIFIPLVTLTLGYMFGKTR
jgi:hypothetical protein